jgi:hypothetical protein
MFQGEPSCVGLTTGPLTFFAWIVYSGRANMGMDGTSLTMYLASASLSSFARAPASRVAWTFTSTFVRAWLQ